MGNRTRTIKAGLLAMLIVIGLGIEHGKARAAETQVLTVAGGCFWCVEADFEKVEGVIEAVSGYTGGNVKNPTYKEVTRGGTGHYEAVEIRFNPDKVSARQLYDLFFRSVDPLDAGGQFCDRGDSYRTAIFVSDAAQKQAAEAAKADAEKELGKRVVTPILNAGPFYEAEDYHQDYYKGDKLILTRFGPKSQASAYKRYREACQRDARVRDLWGQDAPFVN
ncbi:peptide-methionine (S)-S-oxide reductase [Roseovarius halotolerans]|uniref:Peptide methionine sulfoxide reductase MsrA n=1 Tax=Roseovarius halotolerans TaxID=505353 RepID=A0A1X6Z3J6_9RHOB|nr:peptide-methionine (S)-S-oxide reductase MsrA [Roseovarius halotolerans]RKT32284.1 peptide-methionine (S)-S-oxide reductase [Roseovarius halotolerans]SLN39264.1 Peptide methionine sulfoxide reductase MsrA [Roseovarius halotolerans]